MKIVSLLPSATEIVYVLCLEDDLRGVTFECDFPPAAGDLPHVSGTALPTGDGLDAAAVDAEVSARIAAGESIYTLDRELIRTIDPDLILAQDLCRVCAVPSGAVNEALDVIGCRAEVLSLDPHRLDEVIGCVGLVGAATGALDRADAVMAELRARVEAVRQRVADRRAAAARPKVLVLEWADPPFNAGHWVPDQVEAAGGEVVLAAAGERSGRLSWEAVADAEADVVLFAPCGFDLAGAVEQAQPVLGRPELPSDVPFWALDANAYFSRPGPRVVDGVELLAEVLAEDGSPDPGRARRLR